MTVELHFNRFEEWPASREARPAAERAVRELLPSGDDRRGAISFTCLTADEIAEMNRRHLEREGATDVLAFPLSGPEVDLMGDVYLCPAVARESARERGLPPAEEVVRLVVHGALHVLGHDHPAGEAREDSEMYRLQEAILGRVLPGREAGGTDPPRPDGPRTPDEPGGGEGGSA